MSGSTIVTGAAGFAGSHLLDLLAADGVDVVAWHRPAGHPPREVAGVRWQAVDLLDQRAVLRAIDDAAPAVVYHCAGAAHVGQSWGKAAATLRVNVLGTHSIVEALRTAAPDARLLITSSALVYGPSVDAIDETHPIRPANPYGLSKVAQEMVAWGEGGHRHTYIARPFNHFGPRQDPTFVSAAFARQIARIEAGLSRARDSCRQPRGSSGSHRRPRYGSRLSSHRRAGRCGAAIQRVHGDTGGRGHLARHARLACARGCPNRARPFTVSPQRHAGRARESGPGEPRTRMDGDHSGRADRARPARLLAPSGSHDVNTSTARTAGAVTLVLALTILVTWPLAPSMSSMLSPHFDAQFSIWRLGWIAHALATAPTRIFDANIFYPAPRTLAYSDATMLQGVLGAPLFWAGVSPVFIYNAMLFAGFAASGLALFLLMRHLSGSTEAFAGCRGDLHGPAVPHRALHAPGDAVGGVRAAHALGHASSRRRRLAALRSSRRRLHLAPGALAACTTACSSRCGWRSLRPRWSC